MTLIRGRTAPIRLADIFWGGRVRRTYQSQIRAIASKAAVDADTRYEGNMLSSAQHTRWRFLDGGVSEKRGWLEVDCGLFVDGSKARQYVLYRLGASPTQLLAKKEEIFAFSQLRLELARQKRGHATSHTR